MPASSISGLVSTSVYFAAVLLLMVVIAGPAVALYHDSSVAASSRLARGIATQIDDLSPGMKTLIEFGTYPGMSAAVTLSASNVTASVGGYSTTLAVVWQLSPVSLAPGNGYVAQLVGGVVKVA